MAIDSENTLVETDGQPGPTKPNSSDNFTWHGSRQIIPGSALDDCHCCAVPARHHYAHLRRPGTPEVEFVVVYAAVAVVVVIAMLLVFADRRKARYLKVKATAFKWFNIDVEVGCEAPVSSGQTPGSLPDGSAPQQLESGRRKRRREPDPGPDESQAA